ncbi:hypothetical protein AVEN_227734-1 [Araneus ventricosus]|uniref:Uncharacterized protein n=1 Tax=Araneus ventricosus TaxID=182803 RepID=A0A4Y2KF64_ARAVE|nr:hypothetical protein AVEN_227734-1 [Araneus ventricosus]
MLPSSLYRICIQRICDLLKGGTWKNCATNPVWLSKSPFSDLPSEIVDDLMKFAQSRNFGPADVFLLLTSGKLTRLDLAPSRLQTDCVIIQTVIHSKGYKSLRILTRHHSNERIYKPLIETLICNCRNLEVLEIEGMDSDIIVSALENCPKLTSLGYADSLDALETIQEKFMNNYSLPSGKIYGQFQLRKCVWWGRKIQVEGSRYPLYTSGDTSMKSEFLKKLRIAVSVCPLVEELHVNMVSKDSIEELKKLKRLTVLSIDMNNCDGEFLPSFIELLRKIGPQLKRLIVECILYDCHFPVDFICNFCPNLQTLTILGRTTASNSAETKCRLRLKKILITFTDQKALLFLLSNCQILEELVLSNAECFDDSLLDRIMKTNPLSDLKSASIQNSNISRNGFRRLLKKKVSL